ncbi:MAG: hypothetical protein RJA83_1522 [Pseudomonadota bacterium]|jgi:hypothetical protein
MTTINPNIGTNSIAFFQDTLKGLLANKSLSGKTESQLSTIMEYITNNIRVHTLSEDTLEKLIALRANFLSVLCPINVENSSNNQTTSNTDSYFTKFSNALHGLESFFYPQANNNQSSLKESCETALNSVTNIPFSLASKILAAVGHGAVIGTSNGLTAIALESAKSKGYTPAQLRLLKAGATVFNSLVIASHASIVSAMENSHESDEARIEKIWQSFAISLASSTSTYAVVNGINYLAKSIENKLVKGLLNALPLAANVWLLAQSGDGLAESATIVGTDIATAGLFTTAIQTGWNLSKRRHTEENTDIELGLRSNMAETTSSSSSTDETAFYNNGAISSNNAASVYEEINEVSKDGYLIPNQLSSSVIDPTPGPALPDRNRDAYENHGFFVLNKGKGILVSNACSDDISNLTRPVV